MYHSQVTNNIDPPCWDLLDETGTNLIEYIVEDEDQGPSKEWGPQWWYCHPTEEHILKAFKGKPV